MMHGHMRVSRPLLPCDMVLGGMADPDTDPPVIHPDPDTDPLVIHPDPDPPPLGHGDDVHTACMIPPP